MAKGFAIVAGFSGRRVGALKAANGDLEASSGEGVLEPFDVLEVVLGERPRREDLRLKRLLKADMDVGEMVLFREEAEQRVDGEVSRMNGMI